MEKEKYSINTDAGSTMLPYVPGTVFLNKK